MNKYEVLVNKKHLILIAAKSRKEVAEHIAAVKENHNGIIWECLKDFPANAKITILNRGRI